MKLWRFVLMAAGINLALFIIVSLLPFNPIQVALGHLVKGFAFFAGVKISAVIAAKAVVLIASKGILTLRLGLFQSFYEFLTIIALTIPLYLKSWKKLLEHLAIVIGIMLLYYTLLFGITIVVFVNHGGADLLLKFIDYNKESFMIFFFSVIWFLVNKAEILKMFKQKSGSL